MLLPLTLPILASLPIGFKSVYLGPCFATSYIYALYSDGTKYMAMVQNQCYHFGMGAPPVHWPYEFPQRFGVRTKVCCHPEGLPLPHGGLGRIFGQGEHDLLPCLRPRGMWAHAVLHVRGTGDDVCGGLAKLEGVWVGGCVGGVGWGGVGWGGVGWGGVG